MCIPFLDEKIFYFPRTLDKISSTFQGDLSRALELSKQDQYNTSAGVYCVSPIKSEPVPPKSSRQNKPPSRALELLEHEYKSSSSSELCAVSPIKDDDRPPAISRAKSSSNPVKSSAPSKDDKSLSKVKSEVKERKPLSTGTEQQRVTTLTGCVDLKLS